MRNRALPGWMTFAALAALFIGCTANTQSDADTNSSPNEELVNGPSPSLVTTAQSTTLLTCSGRARTSFSGDPTKTRISVGINTLRNCAGANTSIVFVTYSLSDLVAVNCGNAVTEQSGSSPRLTLIWSDSDRTSIAVGPFGYAVTSQAGIGGEEDLVFTLTGIIERGLFVGKPVTLSFTAMPKSAACNAEFATNAFVVTGLATVEVFDR